MMPSGSVASALPGGVDFCLSILDGGGTRKLGCMPEVSDPCGASWEQKKGRGFVRRRAGALQMSMERNLPLEVVP